MISVSFKMFFPLLYTSKYRILMRRMIYGVLLSEEMGKAFLLSFCSRSLLIRLSHGAKVFFFLMMMASSLLFPHESRATSCGRCINHSDSLSTVAIGLRRTNVHTHFIGIPGSGHLCRGNTNPNSTEVYLGVLPHPFFRPAFWYPSA